MMIEQEQLTQQMGMDYNNPSPFYLKTALAEKDETPCDKV